MKCECKKYVHLELYREEITERIKESKLLKRRFEVIAEREVGAQRLFKCPECEQYWQSSWAWNWGDKEFLFKVPNIEPDKWLADPYVQPDLLMLYSASIQNYLAKNTFVEKEAECRAVDCKNRAVQHSVFCFKHHIESLQKADALPKLPQGRWFAPYQES